jgi:hypothetical protein
MISSFQCHSSVAALTAAFEVLMEEDGVGVRGRGKGSGTLGASGSSHHSGSRRWSGPGATGGTPTKLAALGRSPSTPTVTFSAVLVPAPPTLGAPAAPTGPAASGPWHATGTVGGLAGPGHTAATKGVELVGVRSSWVARASACRHGVLLSSPNVQPAASPLPTPIFFFLISLQTKFHRGTPRCLKPSGSSTRVLSRAAGGGGTRTPTPQFMTQEQLDGLKEELARTDGAISSIESRGEVPVLGQSVWHRGLLPQAVDMQYTSVVL